MEHNKSIRTMGFAVGFGVLLFVLLLVAGITTGALPWRDSYMEAPSASNLPMTDLTPAPNRPDPTPTPVPTPIPTPETTPGTLDEELPTYTVTVTFSKGGTAVPYGMSAVVEHGRIEIVAVPDEGYAVEDMIVDGVSMGAVTSYVLEDVTRNHSVYISFTRAFFAPSAPTPTPTPPSDWGEPDENGNYG